MSPKPRKHKGMPDNLYPNVQGNRCYYRYRDPRSGKMYSLGTDRKQAIADAIALNHAIYQEIAKVRQERILQGLSAASVGVGELLSRYEKHQDELVKKARIKQSTRDHRQGAINAIRAEFGKFQISDINPKNLYEFTQKYEDKAVMGNAIIIQLKEIFRMGISWGEVSVNPAQHLKKFIVERKRARLTLDTFNAILEQMPHQWGKNAALLALVTGQRVSDVHAMEFPKGDYLEVVQIKTGARVKISKKLRLNTIGMTVGEVIEQCRDKTLSRYLIHHTKYVGMAKPGQQVRLKSLSNEFAAARDKLGIDWGKNTPPSFHEIRSLSARLYEAQGADVQTLLGHKHETMTAEYKDGRQVEWGVVEG